MSGFGRSGRQRRSNHRAQPSVLGSDELECDRLSEACFPSRRSESQTPERKLSEAWLELRGRPIATPRRAAPQKPIVPYLRRETMGRESRAAGSALQGWEASSETK